MVSIATLWGPHECVQVANGSRTIVHSGSSWWKIRGKQQGPHVERSRFIGLLQSSHRHIKQCKPISIVSAMSEDQEGALGREIPDWAERLVCLDNTHCIDGECENLHMGEGWQGRNCRVPIGRGKLVVCAGPERSGSTWLFNALRLLLEQSGERVHSYWIHSITDVKLHERGVGRQFDAANVLVKTHRWSDDWNPEVADLIVLTERDICGVVNSYLRVGWRPKDMPYLKTLIERYLHDHCSWKKVAHAVIQYEDLADVGGRELSCLNQLQDLLHLKRQTQVSAISAAIMALPVPKHGDPDPVTKLWPGHIGSSVSNLSGRPSLSESECKILREHAAHLTS